MARSTVVLAALIVAVPALSGCQSIFGSAFKSRGEPAKQQAQSAEDYATTQMAAGRQALDAKQYGLAITAFRNAQRAPEHAAAAHNGLAVAYAQIGRPDLAERYFKLAMSEAPGERRYQTNLENFYRNWPEIAVKTERPMAPAAELPNAALAHGGSPAVLPAAATPADADSTMQQRIAAALTAQSSRVVPAARPDPRRPNPDVTVLSTLRRAIASVAPRRPVAAPAAPVVATATSRATIRIELPQARAVRVSTSEVRIAMPQPQASDPRRRNPAVAARPAKAPAPPPGQPGYPARVVLGGSQ